jgi:hypothetical protein
MGFDDRSGPEVFDDYLVDVDRSWSSDFLDRIVI